MPIKTKYVLYYYLYFKQLIVEVLKYLFLTNYL